MITVIKKSRIQKILKHDSTSADFQGTRNQMNTFHKIRIRNAKRLIIDHLYISSLINKFEILEEIIKDKIDTFLISKAKLDSSFPGVQHKIQIQI